MAIIVSVLFVISAALLLYIQTVDLEGISPKLRKYGVPGAKYVIAAFLGTYGSLAIGALILAPLLAYSRLAHTHSGADLFASLLDRSYFPFQTGAAFVLGYYLRGWLKQGRPVYAWVWPVAQVGIAVLLFRPSAMQSFGAGVWHTYFDWGCGCSATLSQWTIMSPLYPSLAFSAAAFLRGTREPSLRTSPAAAH